MAAVKWYFTSTAFSGLSGYYGATADNEVELDTSAPGSGQLTATIAKGTSESAFAGGTNAAPHAAGYDDWSALPAADSQISLDVSSMHADLSLEGSGETDVARYNASGAQQAFDTGGSWDSSTGSGVKVWTASAVLDVGTAASTDRFGGQVHVGNGGHMDPNDIVIDLGADSYVEFSGGAEPPPPALSLVCGAECQIHSVGSGAAADSHWSSRQAGNDSTPEASTDEARSGSHSLYFSSNTTGGESWLSHHVETDPTFQYFRGYFRIPDTGLRLDLDAIPRIRREGEIIGR